MITNHSLTPSMSLRGNQNNVYIIVWCQLDKFKKNHSVLFIVWRLESWSTFVVHLYNHVHLFLDMWMGAHTESGICLCQSCLSSIGLVTSYWQTWWMRTISTCLTWSPFSQPKLSIWPFPGDPSLSRWWRTKSYSKSLESRQLSAKTSSVTIQLYNSPLFNYSLNLDLFILCFSLLLYYC